MPTYRAFIVASDGHFIDRHDIESEDDDHAIAEVRRIAEGRPIELWQAGRLITRFEPSAGMPGNLFKLYRERKRQ